MAEYLVRLNYNIECCHVYVEADRPYEAKVKAETENPGMTVDQVALIVWEEK